MQASEHFPAPMHEMGGGAQWQLRHSFLTNSPSNPFLCKPQLEGLVGQLTVESLSQAHVERSREEQRFLRREGPQGVTEWDKAGADTRSWSRTSHNIPNLAPTCLSGSSLALRGDREHDLCHRGQRRASALGFLHGELRHWLMQRPWGQPSSGSASCFQKPLRVALLTGLGRNWSPKEKGDHFLAPGGLTIPKTQSEGRAEPFVPLHVPR